MKKLFYFCCTVTVAIGGGFYLYPGTSPVSKASQETPHPIEKNASSAPATQITHDTPAKATPPRTRTASNACGCCQDTLAKIRQQRKELEMWAREMIDTHGYEEGIKRVSAKSSTLAKRIQGLLETEKKRSQPPPAVE